MERKREIQPLTPEDRVYAQNLIEQYDTVIRKIINVQLDPDLKSEFEDLVQDVYERICVQLEDFKTYDSPEALVVTIATRAVWRKHRDRKETVPLADIYPAGEEDRTLDDLLPLSTTPEDRRLLTAIYRDRDTEKEVAQDLGEKPATVRQRVKRARDRLKKVL